MTVDGIPSNRRGFIDASAACIADRQVASILTLDEAGVPDFPERGAQHRKAFRLGQVH
jgi:hypothetical protein